VGRRDFAEFISEYVEMKSGPFIAVEDGSTVGTHEGIAAYTHGQRARIGGKAEAFYVVGKDVPENTVFVASGPSHPALFCLSAISGILTSFP
jgi:tRNA U34 2-thiouridine synthase MnmA/TrmU